MLAMTAVGLLPFEVARLTSSDHVGYDHSWLTYPIVACLPCLRLVVQNPFGLLFDFDVAGSSVGTVMA
jgi:hypothetical protein